MTTPIADVNQRQSRGTVAPGFEAVRNRLDMFLLADPTYSAQLAAYCGGELVVDLVGGPDLEEESITGVFSATKGLAGLTFGTLLREGLIDLDDPVAVHWPEFADHGKGDITVRTLLSHQAGLVGVDGGFEPGDILDSTIGATRIAAQRPQWRPGSAIGYHGLTIGIFLEELTRRVTGSSLQDRYENLVRRPVDAPFWLGLPEEQDHRYRPILPMQPTLEEQAASLDRAPAPDGITALMYNSVNAETIPSTGLSLNDRALRAAGPAAIGGVGSALGLARAYGHATGQFGAALLDDDTIAEMSQQHSWGHDRALDLDMCFGVVFMKPQPRMEFGSYRAFGHDGAGGAIGFADPMYDLAFGYIPMPMQYPGGADPKGVELSRLVREAILRAG